MASQLPKDYKVAVFESKGAPLTFKQVKLELPKTWRGTMNPIGKKRLLCVPHTLLPLTRLLYSQSHFLVQVLVKVLAVGVCHSDAAVQEGLFGNGFPIVPGHEIIGTVAAVPDSEKVWKEGDRVGGPWHGGHDGEDPSKKLLPSCVSGMH